MKYFNYLVAATMAFSINNVFADFGKLPVGPEYNIFINNKSSEIVNFEMFEEKSKDSLQVMYVELPHNISTIRIPVFFGKHILIKNSQNQVIQGCSWTNDQHTGKCTQGRYWSILSLFSK